jgi:hypothetical protein
MKGVKRKERSSREEGKGVKGKERSSWEEGKGSYGAGFNVGT